MSVQATPPRFASPLVLALLGLLLVPTGARSEPPWSARASLLLEQHRSARNFPGLALGVVADGEVALATAVGTARPDGGAALTGGSRFRIASVSKPFTTVTLLRLAQAGKLALDDPAGRHCPEFAPPNGAPSLRQLLVHQGGLRHFTDREDTTWTGEFPRLAESVARFGKEKLPFAPGTRSEYSSLGFTVLGCAIETATGTGYFEALRTEVLEPAAIPGVVRDRPDLGIDQVVPAFRFAGKKLVPSEVVDTRFKTPASGLVASAEELARFAAALYGGKLLPPDTVASMSVPVRGSGDQEALFTLGWQVASDRSRGAAYYHAGSMEGATALLYLLPERRYAVALLANRERAVPDLLPLLREIHELVLGK